MQESEYQLCITKIDTLREHLGAIEEQKEAQGAENQRLREVVRLAEVELQKRRHQIQELEAEINALQQEKNEARVRVENAIERLDQMMEQSSGAKSDE
jgi:chromosome segregation ATPase